MVVLAISLMLSGIIIGVVLPARLYGGTSAGPVIVVTMVGVGVILLCGMRVSRFARRIAQSDGFLCLNCHYDLHGLPDSGECPECGVRFDRARLERLWDTWLKDNTKGRGELRPRLEGPNTPVLPRAHGPDQVALTVLPIVLLCPLTLAVFALTRIGVPAWVGLPIWIGLPTLAIWNGRRVGRFHQRVKAAGGLLCLRCRTPMVAQDDGRAVCGRCGRGFDAGAVKARWSEYLKR